MSDGGQTAFPASAEQCNSFDAEAGMTLRDYFAAKAMQGFLAARAASHAGEDGEKVVAQDSYIVADAMIAEKEK